MTLHYGSSNRWALVVTDRQLLPARTGNRIRILGLIRALRELGWAVALVICDGANRHGLELEVERVCVVRGLPFRGGDIATFDVGPFRRIVERVTAALRPALVIAEYAWMAPAMARLPRGALRVVDCHDVLHERTLRFSEAGLDPWLYCTALQESRLLDCADVLFATQHNEAATLKRLLPQKNVCCVLPFIDLPNDFQAQDSNPSMILAVGSGHAGNRAILGFALDLWPLVARRAPDLHLYVAGAIGSDAPAARGVTWLGELESLEHVYQSASVVLCPVEVGTGAKIKVIEALRFGKAVIATPAAVEGFPIPARPAWIGARNVSDVAETLVGLLLQPNARSQLGREAFEYGERYLSRKNFLATLRPLLPTLLSSRIRALIQ
jgi:glycosyltransferase involved in cell wall biosynthesis